MRQRRSSSFDNGRRRLQRQKAERGPEEESADIQNTAETDRERERVREKDEQVSGSERESEREKERERETEREQRETERASLASIPIVRRPLLEGTRSNRSRPHASPPRPLAIRNYEAQGFGSVSLFRVSIFKRVEAY